MDIGLQSGCQGTEEGVSVADIIKLALLRRAEKQRQMEERKEEERKTPSGQIGK